MMKQPKNYQPWWEEFGLEHNPYVYGPMPWKRTGQRYRMIEAGQRGWVCWRWDDEYREYRDHEAF